jgi:hypothetical protein
MNKMSISSDDEEKLLAVGYTHWEINEFGNATTPDGVSQKPFNLDGETWSAAIKSRQDWFNELMSKGWTYQQYEQAIYDQYTRNPNQSPWDFLKSEYKPPQHADFRTTIEATKRVRNFKTSVRRQLRTDSKKIERDIRGVSSNKEEQEYFSGTLGETIRRLNKQ